MSDDFSAKTDQGLGAAEEVIGQGVGSRRMRANGEVKQAKGKAKEGVESARKAVNAAAGQAAAAVSKAADQATSLYASAKETARSVSDQVDPFVNERPYAAVAIGVVAGILLGTLFFGRGAKVIYVRAPR